MCRFVERRLINHSCYSIFSSQFDCFENHLIAVSSFELRIKKATVYSIKYTFTYNCTLHCINVQSIHDIDTFSNVFLKSSSRILTFPLRTSVSDQQTQTETHEVSSCEPFVHLDCRFLLSHKTEGRHERAISSPSPLPPPPPLFPPSLFSLSGQ